MSTISFHTGKGLTLISSVIEGDFNDTVAECIAAKQVCYCTRLMML